MVWLIIHFIFVMINNKIIIYVIVNNKIIDYFMIFYD